MTTRRKRADAFFSQARLDKLAHVLIGYDKSRYNEVRKQLQADYESQDRKTPFYVTWSRAIAVLREKYGYCIPDAVLTTHMKEKMRLMRLNYERRLANDAEEAAEHRREIAAWKENF
jgi:hypothetical protein